MRGRFRFPADNSGNVADKIGSIPFKRVLICRYRAVSGRIRVEAVALSALLP